MYKHTVCRYIALVQILHLPLPNNPNNPNNLSSTSSKRSSNSSYNPNNHYNPSQEVPFTSVQVHNNSNNPDEPHNGESGGNRNEKPISVQEQNKRGKTQASLHAKIGHIYIYIY